MRCANKNLVFLFFVLLIAGCKPVEENINKGQFKMARKRINREIISNTCDPMRRIELENQKERMWRIEQDFNKSREDILPFIKKYYPDVTAKQLTAWEDEKSLEKMTINGQDRYFVRAAENLFRINSEAKQRKISVDGEKNNLLNIFIGQNIPEIIKDLKTQKDITGKPVHMKFSYTLTVDADAVPGGEIVRCWLPFPREENARQTDVELLSANCSDYVLASNQHLQRTVYMQKPAVKGRPTVFEITFLATMRPQWFNLKNVDILPYNKNAQLYQKYTTERYPHIRFSPAVKALSEKIVGDETDP
ncbi:MAG: transglutaminase domain-containing protein, partial [Candidatus Marinimicrobia bacterium]|nr:transglutaminase domain-containing protein [Candidatus Neomarinimicrobiota bacterium]